MIRNPFREIHLADKLESNDIRVMFERNKAWEKVLEPSNQIIIGTTGCGKSMLLKKMSASSMDEDNFPKTHKFFGIYLHVSRITRYFNSVFDSILRSINNDRVFWNKKLIVTTNIYSQYMCLWLLERLCEEIKDSSNYAFYPLSRVEVREIIKDICNLLDIKDCKDLDEIILQIKRQISEIDNYFSGDWLTKDTLDIRLFSCLNIYTLPEVISNIILNAYNSIAKKEKLYVYFLLDTSEYIHPECQKVHNSFFERGFSFRTKLAKRPYHLTTLETLSGKNIKQDTEFSVIFLDYLPDDKEAYKKFLIKALGKELDYIKRNYPEYENIVIDPLKFLNTSGNEYNDLLSMCSMGGVSIRDFINILGKAFDLLIKETGIKKEISLPPSFQEIALKKHSERQLEQVSKIEQLDKSFIPERDYPKDKISWLYDFLIGLLKRLKKENKKMSELIVEIKELFISEDIQAFLKPAFADGVFRFISEDSFSLFIVPNKFYVNLLFLSVPKFNLLGKNPWTCPLSTEEIKEITRKYFGGKIEEVKQPLGKYKAFLSCSFEKDPLLTESRRLIKPALKSVDIECYDAEELNITFQTQGIRNAIENFDFTIAELSSPTPNILFEMGIAAAYKKTIISLVNKEKILRRNITDLLELPMNAYDYDLKEESLSEKARQIRNSIDNRMIQEQSIEEPAFKETSSGRSLRPKSKSNMIFISYPQEHSSLWERALKEIKGELEGLKIITEQTSGLSNYEAGKFQIPIFCASLSKFCIIDTSGKEMPDLFQSYVLGLSFGLGKNTLRIEESTTAKKEGLLLWSSYRYETWSNIEELTNVISRFVISHK
ncbi:MAG: hypothetical protein AB1297_02970 [bacterium]